MLKENMLRKEYEAVYGEEFLNFNNFSNFPDFPHNI